MEKLPIFDKLMNKKLFKCSSSIFIRSVQIFPAYEAEVIVAAKIICHVQSLSLIILHTIRLLIVLKLKYFKIII